MYKPPTQRFTLTSSGWKEYNALVVLFSSDIVVGKIKPSTEKPSFVLDYPSEQ